MNLSYEMSNEAYHADRTAVSKSWLDRINQSPKHLHHYLTTPPKPQTEALQIGSLAHSLILENDISRYVVTPTFNCGSNAGKQAYLSYLSELDSTAAEALEDSTQGKPKREDMDLCLTKILESQHKITCTQEQLKTVIAIRDAVYQHEAARMILSAGHAEVTSFYVDPDTGVQCKARADWYRPDVGIVADLKSTTDASAVEVARSIAKYRYHVQAAHYLQAFEADKFLFVFFEKEAPYGVAVYDSAEILPWGRAQRKANLTTYARCQMANEWPCYYPEIQSIALPRWAQVADTSVLNDDEKFQLELMRRMGA